MKKYIIMLVLSVFMAVSATSHSHAFKKGDVWIKLCLASKKSKSRKNCVLMHEKVNKLSGRTGLRVIARKSGGKKRTLLISMDKDLHNRKGMLLRVDKNKPVRVVTVRCSGRMCLSGAILTPDLHKQMMRGRKMVLAFRDRFGSIRGFHVSLKGYASAYKGKAISAYKYFRYRNYAVKKIKKKNNDKLFEELFGF